MDSVTGSTPAGEWLASGCGVPTGAASQCWLWSMFTVKMYRLHGWRTLSKLTQGLSSHVTSPVTTPVMTVGVHRQTSVRQTSSHTADTKTLKTRYDVVIIGAGKLNIPVGYNLLPIISLKSLNATHESDIFMLYAQLLFRLLV